MAYDPLTGVTTYGQADAATDPNAALPVAAAAPTPSTATAPTQSPTARYPMFGDLDPAQYDAFGNPVSMGWHGGYDAFGNPDSTVSLPPTPEQERAGFLYGGIPQQFVDQSLSTIAQMAGLPQGFDWGPFLEQAAQQHQAKYGTGYSRRYTNYAHPIAVAVQLAAAANPDLAPFVEVTGAGSEFWNQGNLARDAALHADTSDAEYYAPLSVLAAPFAAALFAPAALSGESAALASTIGGASGMGLTAEEAAALGAGGALSGGGMLNSAAQNAAVGGLTSALGGANPVYGALRGGVSGLAGPATELLGSGIQSVFDTFNPDIAFADTSNALDITKKGMLAPSTVASPDMFASPFDVTAMDSEPYLRSAFGPSASQVPDMPVAQAWRGSLGLSFDPTTGASFDPLTGMATSSVAPSAFDGAFTAGMLPTAQPTVAAAAPEAPAAPAAQQPSTTDIALKLAKLGAKLAQINEGQGVPQDAPQRAQDQSDADYAQSLASYINVDAKALADMGLVPGTPDYYNYLMSQLDATINNMAGTIDVDAPDLEQQLRGKTREEIMNLQRALYVRGQLGTLMGSGTYTDPFTGRGEEVITNGRLVNPDVAAYHRGLGRSIDEFSRLSPLERQRAIGGFLDRSPDLYGMQARADARDEQAAQAQALAEDLKRRRSSFFSTSQPSPEFSTGSTGDPELDQLLGLNYEPSAALRTMYGQ